MRIIIGPCAIESEGQLLACAYEVAQLRDAFSEVDFIFKACYSKANRSDKDSFHGVGIDEGLRLLQKVRNEFGLDVISDVHSEEEIRRAKYVLDYLQVPQSLARYTDIVEAAGDTGLPVYIKNGVGMSAEQALHAVDKAKRGFSWRDIRIVERGHTFGNNDVVVDMRNFAKWRGKVKTCIDATHPSLNSEYATTLLYAGIAAGADDIFMEAHTDPKNALCDGKCMLTLNSDMYYIIDNTIKLKKLTGEFYGNTKSG